MPERAKKTTEETGGGDEYRLGGSTYRKVLDEAGGKYLFSRDGRPISLREWNRTVNRFQPMENKTRHPWFPVRLIEGRRRRRLVDHVGPRAGELGADIGCEGGHITEALLQRGARVVALDLDDGIVAKARGRAGEGAVFLCGDVGALPLKSGILDFCLCAETVEHIEDVGGALAEMARVVRPGGRLIVAVPNEGLILFIKKALRRIGFGRFLGQLSEGQAMGHLRSFSPPELTALLPAGIGRARVFYDKPFFLYLYLVVEISGGYNLRP